MKSIGYIATFILVVSINVIISGWSLSVIWEWFVVGLFGLPALNIPSAIGLMLVFNFITPDIKYESEKSDSFIGTMFEAFIKVVSRSFTVVGIGWVVLQFI